MSELTFNACEFLDFSDHFTAKKQEVIIGGEKKACWKRPVIDETYPSLVQFCKKRGRINSEIGCLCKSSAVCSDFSDFEHTIII